MGRKLKPKPPPSAGQLAYNLWVQDSVKKIRKSERGRLRKKKAKKAWYLFTKKISKKMANKKSKSNGPSWAMTFQAWMIGLMILLALKAFG